MMTKWAVFTLLMAHVMTANHVQAVGSSEESSKEKPQPDKEPSIEIARKILFRLLMSLESTTFQEVGINPFDYHFISEDAKVKEEELTQKREGIVREALKNVRDPQDGSYLKDLLTLTKYIRRVVKDTPFDEFDPIKSHGTKA